MANSIKISPRRFKNYFGTFNDYSEVSTLHSVNYIGKKNIHCLERLFWILAFFFSLVSCCYLIFETYKKWERDPVLVSFKERTTSISQIPFPAVTICPPSPYAAPYFDAERVMEDVKSGWSNVHPHNKLRLESLSKICDYNVNLKYNETERKIINMLLSIANTFGMKSEAISSFCGGWCSFEGIFRKTLTERGACRSFNMLDRKDIYTDKMEPGLQLPIHNFRSNWSVYGYHEETTAFAYPVRNLGSGPNNALELTLTVDIKDIENGKNCYKTPSTFYMALHTPDEMPRIGINFFQISFDGKTTVVIEPKVTTTSPYLRRYSPEQRQCFFENDKKLKFFKAYSQAKCLDECFAEYVLEECGCVAIHMPHEAGTKLCRNLSCIKKSEKFWKFHLFEAGLNIDHNNKQDKDNPNSLANVNKSSVHGIKLEDGKIRNFGLSAGQAFDIYGHKHYFNHNLSDLLFSDIKNSFFSEKLLGVMRNPPSCDCLPACNSIKYDSVVSQLNGFDKGLRNETAVTVRVSIYMDDDYFIEIRRTELYDWINFLSNCGGFLGLLMGASFLSFVELIYHFAVRPFFMKFRKPITPQVRHPRLAFVY